MKFSKVGEHTIKCVISEEEIYDLGFTVDEIMSNGERTQEFMNQIFDMAEEKFKMKFDMGIKTVRADFLSNHTLMLTFSEHPATEGMMEHIKDILSGIISASSQTAKESISQSTEDDENGIVSAGPDSVVMIEFPEFDLAMKFAKLIKLEEFPPSQLYKEDDFYYLEMDLAGIEKSKVKLLSMQADEYASDILPGAMLRAHFLEHADVLLEKEAIEFLREM